ncbi:hypothetical protein I8752_32255 [Nostocaceae cyanobacterium CENA369]|uniref:Uncharacterized protein n=1 Tax=Dendronalium phyllosphericum CENA369 TaxID=1725256 RepID=A0A8J7I8N0_9NOST|nr:hypothetical protein [Dendronalium phyllosphericum]MBH8577559.1 hypothetical protein [Dendronalium phyllosphericum CENA369]
MRVKSDGWQWHNTRLLDSQRAERLWLAIALSTLWMVMLGGEAENLSSLPPVPCAKTCTIRVNCQYY